MIKELIKEAVNSSVEKYLQDNSIDVSGFEFEIETPKNIEFGDYSTNAALILANKIKSKPRDLAEKLIEILNSSDNTLFKKMEVAGPGFINFHLNEEVFLKGLMEIESKGEKWGSSDSGSGQKILVEFVSANPTGYLHFGHARNAAVGDSLSRILKYSGYEVTKEFYINDAGRQMDLLGESVFVRYKQLFDIDIEIPEDGYQAEYITDIANDLKSQKNDSLLKLTEEEAKGLCKEFAYNVLLNEIKLDLLDAGVEFDEWYSEKENIHSTDDGINVLEQVKELLNNKSSIFENEGALWFKATDFGDTQDWVLVKSDGLPTYFYADIAYHNEKIKRGYNRLINIWGADHHSHVSRLKSAVKALYNDDNIIEVLLIQFVRLIRDGKEVAMSKRSGSFVTLREVLKEVGRDVTRYFLLMRSTDSHLDFDLDLAKEQSSENPVYYIQYAHARIESVLTKAGDSGFAPSPDFIESLQLQEEMQVVKKLLQFPEIVDQSAALLSPHRIAFYLQDLASEFHVYYNRNKILTENSELTTARLYFIACIQTVLRNGLSLLGISAPRRM